MSEARSHYGMQLAKLQDRLTELQQGVKAEHEKSATLQSQVRALTDEVKTARAAKEVAQQQLSQSKNDNVLVSYQLGNWETGDDGIKAGDSGRCIILTGHCE